MASLAPFLCLALFLSLGVEVVSSIQSLPLNTTFKAHTSGEDTPWPLDLKRSLLKPSA